MAPPSRTWRADDEHSIRGVDADLRPGRSAGHQCEGSDDAEQTAALAEFLPTRETCSGPSFPVAKPGADVPREGDGRLSALPERAAPEAKRVRQHPHRLHLSQDLEREIHQLITLKAGLPAAMIKAVAAGDFTTG